MIESIRPENSDLSRRDFVKSLAAVTLASSVPLAESISATDETAVARFFKSLTDDQKARICFPFDHPLRFQVSNNWAIVKPSIKDLNAEQKTLCREIFKNLCSDDGHTRFLRQMNEDCGGFENYHVAVFGEPASGKPFEWVITGRHATLRADGNRGVGASFGGPIFYGHASRDLHEPAKHAGNVWWYQAARAKAIFKTLDDKQRARSLVSKATHRPPRPTTSLDDLGLDGSQKASWQTLLNDLLMPFRDPDAGEILSCLRDPGAADALRLTYYQQGDIGQDGTWDVWKLEGPSFSWYFHGSPHIHVWLNVGGKAGSRRVREPVNEASAP